MLIKLKKAQATAEYAILFAIVIGAAIGMQSYIKRALQGRLYDAANNYVTSTGGNTLQYEPTSGYRETTAQATNRAFSEEYSGGADPFTYNESTTANYTSETTQ